MVAPHETKRRPDRSSPSIREKPINNAQIPTMRPSTRNHSQNVAITGYLWGMGLSRTAGAERKGPRGGELQLYARVRHVEKRVKAYFSGEIASAFEMSE